MFKQLGKKVITSNAAEKSGERRQVSDLAVNEVLAEQLLMDAEDEVQREMKFKNDHVEYLRVTRKPLLFGLEESVTYNDHGHMKIQGCIQNFNNKVFGTWDFKSFHLWDMETGQQQYMKSMMSITQTHCTISAVAFSHKYRLYLVITSTFQWIFMNERCYPVTILSLNKMSAVNFVEFNDKQNQLVTAGNKGVFIHNFRYEGKYDPKLAATHDKFGHYIKVQIVGKRMLLPIVPWVKGMKIDQKSGIIITWSQGSEPQASKGPNKLGNAAAVSFNKAQVGFNWLNASPPNGNDSGARLEQEVDEQTMNKTVDAVKKLINSQKLTNGIVEGHVEVMKCVEDKTILAVIMATDITDEKFKKNFMAKAATCNANVIEIGTKDELTLWLGKKQQKGKKFQNAKDGQEIASSANGAASTNKTAKKIAPVSLFAIKHYGDESDSWTIVRNFIDQQKVQRQNKTGDLIALFKDIMDFGEQILDVLVFIDYRYFLISTDVGNIYVFKYVQTGKVELQKRLIHTYNGHSKNITHLDKITQFPHLFMSVSLDGTARVWSLETFMHLYTIEIPGTLSFCNLLNRCKLVLSQAHSQVRVHNLHMIVENYMNSESQVLQLTPSYHTLQDKEFNHVGFTISVCQDNSAVIKDIDNALACYDKTTLYPPPSAQTIKKIVYSTQRKRLILLLSSSTICIYKRVKETALLEKILDPSEIKDCEMKRAFSQQVTCMEIIHTQRADQILPFDTEVLNLRMHESVLEVAMSDTSAQKEFIVLGLSKGAVLLFHVEQLNQVYCRFTVHREQIKVIKYLPNTQTFLTVCKEGHMIFWQVGQERKVNKMKSFKMPSEKKIYKVHVMAPAYHRHRIDVTCDRIMVIFKSGESEIFDFELGGAVELQEGEEESPLLAQLYLLENEKQKEHDCKITGIDSSQQARLAVTSDIQGNIKIWSLEKRFLREIQFPTAIDSVCFLNKEGDILVSHVHRISKILYSTYWTSSFTNFGFTNIDDPIHLKYKQTEATIETEVYDDHIFAKAPPSRTRVVNQEHFESLFRSKSEDEMMNSNGAMSKTGDLDSNTAQSTLRKTNAHAIKGQSSNRKQSGFLASEASSAMETNAMSSRLQDSTMRKGQQLTVASQQDISQRGSKFGVLKNATIELGIVSHLSKETKASRLAQTNAATGQAVPIKLPIKKDAKPLLRRRKSSMTMPQLIEKEKQQAIAMMEEASKAEAELEKRRNGPGNIDAVPRERNPFAQKQVLQPLPGISYLSTSPVYYEMLAKRKKQKGFLNKGLTRRKITENRISGNIMNFNAPVAVNDFSDMELSIDYHTQVSQHKYNQSNFLPLMNLQILSKIPIEQILNPNLDTGDTTDQHNLGMPPNAQLNMSQHSRKSRSNMPFRTNSFGGAFGQSDRNGSRNTNRSGKETAASHVTHGSNRHSLVKPIGYEGQQLHAMLQPNNQVSDVQQSNGRNGIRPTQRTNIMMTGNQIVGGNMVYPKTTRNAANQQIQLGSSQQRSAIEDGGGASMISQFDNSLIIEGKAKMMRSNVGDGASHQITDVSGNASFLGSETAHQAKPRENADESQNNITQIMDISRTNPQHASQMTQETSKQVFGSKQGMMASPGGPRQGGGKVQDISSVGGELASIKEDQNVGSRNQINNEGLVQDDSIIENDQPSVMLPKGGRLPVGDYKHGGQQSPDKAMGLTGDSFADSIMSNHYQNK